MHEPIDSCIFCQIAEGTIPATKRAESDTFVAFDDISPKAPIHILIIPKRHIVSVADLEASDAILMGQLLMFAKELADQVGLAPAGYRLVLNVRRHGGQEVDHVHLHLLGGTQLGSLRYTTKKVRE